MKNIKSHAYPIFLIAFPVAFLFTTSLFFAIANAADVTLAWDANTESDLAGYKLYYDGDSDTEMYQGVGATEGDSPIAIYTEDLSDENSPSFTITGLEEGEYYYFSLTAFDKNGVESDFSDEVGITVGSDVGSDAGSQDENGSGCFISGAMANHSAGLLITIAAICLIFGVVAEMESRRIALRA